MYNTFIHKSYWNLCFYTHFRYIAVKFIQTKNITVYNYLQTWWGSCSLGQYPWTSAMFFEWEELDKETISSMEPIKAGPKRVLSSSRPTYCILVEIFIWSLAIFNILPVQGWYKHIISNDKCKHWPGTWLLFLTDEVPIRNTNWKSTYLLKHSHSIFLKLTFWKDFAADIWAICQTNLNKLSEVST